MTDDRKFAVLITLLKYAVENNELRTEDRSAPTAEWISEDHGFRVRCSKCQQRSVIRTRYCSSCGRRMKKV